MPAKRKRQSNTAIPLPSAKRVAIVDNFELGPIIASAPGLTIPSNIKFTPYAKSNKIGSSPEFLLQSSSQPVLDYVAREDNGQTKHYIGIWDPVTKKMEVHPAQKMTIRGSLRREREEIERDRAAAAAAAAAQRRTKDREALILEFGGAKARKAAQSLTENAIRGNDAADITSNPVTAALLQGITDSTADMPTKEDLKSAIDSSRPRPKADLNASSPADVYPLATLVPKSASHSLPVQEWIDAVAAREPIKVASKYVSNRIVVLAQANEIKKLRALKWTLCLITFYKQLRSRGGKKTGPKQMPKREVLEKALGIPANMIGEIVRTFAPQGSELSKWHVDFLTTHICALALHVDNYDVDTFDLHEDLSLEARDCSAYFQEIGCKVAPPSEAERQRLGLSKAEGASHRIAKLRIPLTFKTVEARRLKRR